MKKFYEKPSMELVEVELESAVLAASGDEGGDYEGEGGGNGSTTQLGGSNESGTGNA